MLLWPLTDKSNTENRSPEPLHGFRRPIHILFPILLLIPMRSWCLLTPSVWNRSALTSIQVQLLQRPLSLRIPPPVVIRERQHSRVRRSPSHLHRHAMSSLHRLAVRFDVSLYAFSPRASDLH